MAADHHSAKTELFEGFNKQTVGLRQDYFASTRARRRAARVLHGTVSGLLDDRAREYEEKEVTETITRGVLVVLLAYKHVIPQYTTCVQHVYNVRKLKFRRRMGRHWRYGANGLRTPLQLGQ